MNEIDLKKLKKILNKLVVQDLAEALSTFDDIVEPDSRLEGDLLLLNAQYNTLKREKNYQTITPQFADIKANRIVVSLTSYIKELTEEDLVLAKIISKEFLKDCLIVDTQTEPGATVTVVTDSNPIHPTKMKDKTPINIFISYAHKDEAYKDDLGDHLSGLVRNQTIAPWQDRQIQPGMEWDKEIKAALDRADYILLLVSSSFMGSNYINDVEIKKALERHAKGEVTIIPILVRPCDFSSLPISRFQALPKDAKPISRWEDKDEAFLDVVKRLKGVFNR